jgi:hypothetical protein
MDEDLKESMTRLAEAVMAKRIVCSPQFVADVAELESMIRELEIENDINRLRLFDWVMRTPDQDRQEIGALLAKQAK